MLNVLIADSHPVARAGLHMLVEQVAESLGDECLIAYTDDALTVIRKARRLQPDLILLSSNLSSAAGAQTVLALRGFAPATKLLILSDDDGEAALRAYVDAGADGVIASPQEAALIRAERETRDCDLFIAIGSSLQVMPAAGFPVLAKHVGARLVILNRDSTQLDEIADLVLNREIGPTLGEAANVN